jgi:shikimate kinase
VAEIEQVLAERAPLYRAAAHLIMDTTGLSIEQVVKRILTAISDG